MQEELEVFLDDLPICVEKDRCIDMPEFFLWTLKLSETIEQVRVLPRSCRVLCSLFAPTPAAALLPWRSASAHMRARPDRH